MSGAPYVPPLNPYLLPEAPFDALVASAGQRVSWARAHVCPCTYGGGGPQGLPMPGTAAPNCQQCFGVGVYWDAPTEPFQGLVTFMHMSPTPDEPGLFVNDTLGQIQEAQPTLTIPFQDPSASQIPNPAWQYASISDIFILPDSLTRYTAVLQVGGLTALPYQQNVAIAASGAVTTYDPSTQTVSFPAYTTSGTAVLLSGAFPLGTNYIVDFLAAPLYVAFRRSGGLPHARQFGAGIVNLPRRFRLQTLDLWTRERLGGAATTYSRYLNGAIFPYLMMSGQVIQT